jgi:hypothetical protein
MANKITINNSTGEIISDGYVVSLDPSTTAELSPIVNQSLTWENTSYKFNYKNKIINGSMEIDQQYNGASTNITASNEIYATDQFFTYNTRVSSTGTVQQVSEYPPGFKKSLKYTSTTIGTSAVGMIVGVSQQIEGYNLSDLKFGSSDAKYLTLSFWVKTDIGTGSYSIALGLDTGVTSFVKTYQVTAIDTWQKISVTFPPSTSTAISNLTTGIGLKVWWDLGSGSSLSRASEDTNWTSSGSAAFQRKITGTNSITAGDYFSITGVQLEIGEASTTFEKRPYHRELMLCKRYYEKIRCPPGSTYAPLAIAAGIGSTTATDQIAPYFIFQVPKRTNAPAISYDATLITIFDSNSGNYLTGVTAAGSLVNTNYHFSLFFNNTDTSTACTYTRTYILVAKNTDTAYFEVNDRLA